MRLEEACYGALLVDKVLRSDRIQLYPDFWLGWKSNALHIVIRTSVVNICIIHIINPIWLLTCWEKLWLIYVASILRLRGELILLALLSSGASGGCIAVSLTVNKSATREELYCKHRMHNGLQTLKKWNHYYLLLLLVDEGNK